MTDLLSLVAGDTATEHAMSWHIIDIVNRMSEFSPLDTAAIPPAVERALGFLEYRRAAADHFLAREVDALKAELAALKGPAGGQGESTPDGRP